MKRIDESAEDDKMIASYREFFVVSQGPEPVPHH